MSILISRSFQSRLQCKSKPTQLVRRKLFGKARDFLIELLRLRGQFRHRVVRMPRDPVGEGVIEALVEFAKMAARESLAEPWTIGHPGECHGAEFERAVAFRPQQRCLGWQDRILALPRSRKRGFRKLLLVAGDLGKASDKCYLGRKRKTLQRLRDLFNRYGCLRQSILRLQCFAQRLGDSETGRGSPLSRKVLRASLQG